nr:MAG TPA: hypothetical protein [Caudoviricetes sp.]
MRIACQPCLVWSVCGIFVAPIQLADSDFVHIQRLWVLLQGSLCRRRPITIVL